MCSLIEDRTGYRLEFDNQTIISVADLNLVINAFYHNGEGNSLKSKKVTIIPKKPYKRVNIVFVAGLILLRRTFDCRITFITEKLTEEVRLNELMQYNLQSKQIFGLKSEIQYDPRKSGNTIFSSSFTPIFYINKNYSPLLFDNEKFKEHESDEFIRALKAILEKYTEKLTYSEGGSIFPDTSAKSPFFLFVFAILFLKINPSNRKVQKQYQKTEEQIVDSIIVFVQEYSEGIYELAKNIVQHSDRGEGMITVRVYDDGEGDGNILENYVFDFGSKGIIETIKVNTKELLLKDEIKTQPDLRDDLKADLEIMDSCNYSLNNFVEPLVDSGSCQKILNQQIRREIAHFGLMQFFDLITSNDGMISIGTENLNRQIDYYSSQTQGANTNSLSLAKGTSFFFQFPPAKIVGHETKALLLENQEKQISSREIDSFANFYQNYENPQQIVLVEPEDSFNGRNYEQEIINKIKKEINGFVTSSKFIVVDFRNIKKLTPAGFLRILASISQSSNGAHIIVSNVSTILFFKSIDNNKLYFDKIQKNWWIDNNPILCYSFCTISDGRDYYYADILAGKKYEEFVTINKLIHNTFDNAVTIVDNADSSVEVSLRKDNPFFTEMALTPFDIEIKSKSDKSVFINNLELILNKEIDRTENNAERVKDIQLSYIDKLHSHYDGICGYSISDTHFKIGSKIHASRYIYAKRLFNNSYYSSRLALCLAHEISQEAVAKDKTKSLTLLGYEQYSLAMLSLVKKYLENWGYEKVSACHASTNDGKLEIKGSFDSSSDYIIVVPIVSTGSTSIAMVQAVKKPPILYYHIVATESGNADFPTNEFTFEERKKIRKIIRIDTYWSETKNCPCCFGNERKPLLEADKTNLNPLSIFNFPTTKNVSESVNFDLKAFEGDGILEYSVGKKPNGYYRLYSINTDSFINRNLNGVTQWLEGLRVNLQNDGPEDTRIKPTDHIVILAPSSETNTRFINIVNEQVFGSSATILYMQADEEYLENFKLLNIGLFQNINSTKVFFVDDELVSGSSFFKIYYLFRFTTEYNKELRLSGAIFLLNKASDQIDTRVKRASSDNLFSYMAINDQSLFDLAGLSPLDFEYRKYNSLASHSLNIDSRIYFQEKASSFNESITKSNSNRERHLCMFGITHSLYEYFGKFEDKKSGADTIKDFQAISDIEELCVKIKHKREEKYELIKVLCNHPFVMYYDILCKTFELQNKMLKDEISETDTHALTDERINNILFLIRRSVLIKNYYIITPEFFKALSELFDAIEDRNSEDNKDGDLFSNVQATSNYQADFSGLPYYLLRRYTEIVNQNGWCSKQISDNIQNVEFRTEQGKLFKSLLLIEISSVMNNYYDALERHKDWKDFSVFNQDNSFKTISEIKVHKTRIDETLNLNDRNTRDMALSLVSDNNSAFFDTFVWLKKFYSDDKDVTLSTELSLSQKIDAICDHIKELFDRKSVGILFVVVDNRNKYHIVYDRDKDNCNRFTDGYNFNKEDSRGLFELLLPECKKESESLFFDTDEDNNNRMTLRVYHNDNGLKPVCFLSIYGKNEDFSNNIDVQRLLSLIANDLDSFVVRHHKNDEFISLVEAEAENRLSYLMGHGRNTIKRLSDECPELFQEMLDIQEYLQFIYYRKMEAWPFEPNPFNETLFTSLTDDVKKYVEAIYKSTNVEYDVLVNSTVTYDADLLNHITGFSFNAMLIKYICFELIINAKKNRFLFREKNQPNFITVKFSIEAKVGKSQKNEMIISVSSSGPAIPPYVLKKINRGKNVKGSDSPSGLGLINWIIDKTNSERKRYYINMTSVQQNGCPYYNNTVEITIPTVE